MTNSGQAFLGRGPWGRELSEVRVEATPYLGESLQAEGVCEVLSAIPGT